MTWMRAAAGAAALVALVACGGTDDELDAGRTDGGTEDAAPDDAGDAGELDAGELDATIELDAMIELDATMDLDAALGLDAASDDDAGAGDGGGTIDVDSGIVVTVDSGIDAGRLDAGRIDAGPIDASSPSARIDLVRMTSGTLPAPIHIDTVQVTYVLPPVGDDPGGIFVQSDLLGPALFVAIDPSTLTPPPIEGVYASFSVTATAVVNGQHRVTAILPGSWAAGTTPVGGVVAEPQGLRMIAVPSLLDELESELTVNELDMVSDLVACGLDRFCTRVTSAGVPAATNDYRFRTTQSIASALGLARRCHLVMGEYPTALEHATPLWRRGTEAVAQVTFREELTGVACPLPRLVGAYATGPSSATVVFDAPIDPTTVAASDFTWTGGVTTSTAVVSPRSPYLVDLTVAAPFATPSSPVVSVSGVRDVLGIDVVAGTSATVVRTAGTVPGNGGQIVITEVMFDPAGAEPAGEWVELWNPTTSALSLLGCTLADAAGGTHTFTTALTIPAGGRVTLSSGTDPGFPETASYGGAFVLDSTDNLTLTCGSAPIDRVEWTASYQSAPGRSLSLDPWHHAAVLNDAPIAWCTASSAYGAERGTPGAPNDDCR